MPVVAHDTISVGKFRRLLTVGGVTCAAFWVAVVELAARF